MSHMKELIEEAFKVRGAQFLSITKRFWNTNNNYDKNISKTQLIDNYDLLCYRQYICNSWK